MIRRAVKYKSAITKKPISFSKKKKKAPVEPVVEAKPKPTPKPTPKPVVKAKPKPTPKPKPAPEPKKKLKERTPRQEGVSYGDASRILTRALDEAMDYWRERSLIHYEYYRYIKENGKAPQQLSVGGDTYSFDAVLWTAGRYRLT